MYVDNALKKSCRNIRGPFLVHGSKLKNGRVDSKVVTLDIRSHRSIHLAPPPVSPSCPFSAGCGAGSDGKGHVSDLPHLGKAFRQMHD